MMGECSVCQRPTSDLYGPVECSYAEEALIWATVSPAGLAGVACCPLCIDHGIFNRRVAFGLTPAQRDPILDFLAEQHIPFRILDRVPGDKECCLPIADQGSKKVCGVLSKTRCAVP